MGGPKVALKLRDGLRGLGHVCDVAGRAELGNHPRSERLRLAVSPWLARRALIRLEHRQGRYDIVDASSAEGAHLPRRCTFVARSHGLEHRYYEALLADAAAGLLRKPWTHRLWFPVARLSQAARAVRRSRRLIVLNPADCDLVVHRGWAPAAQVEMIPHGVDAVRWANAPAADAPRGAGLLFCGWWTTSKGVAYLADAVNQLSDPPPITLLGVGRAGADWRAAEAHVRSAFAPALQPRLRVLPRTENEDAVFAEYARHDLLVCPSTSEGFGLVVVEALSQRLPVVCTTAVGAAHLLADGVHGRIVPPRDPAALAQAVASLLADPAARRRMGDAGHALAADLHWSAIAQRTLACYQRALEFPVDLRQQAR